MKEKLILFLLLQTIVLFGQETGTLVGHISSAKGGGWLNEIEVSLIGTNLLTKTDSMGNFEIKDIQEGNYIVLVDSFTKKKVIIKPNEETRIFVFLFPEDFYPKKLNNLRVKLKTDKETYNIGDEVIFSMTFINDSDNEIGVLDFSCYPGHSFHFKLTNSKPLQDHYKSTHTIKMGVVSGELKKVNSNDSITLTKTAQIDTNKQIIFNNPHGDGFITCSAVFEAVRNELIIVKYLYNVPEWYQTVLLNKGNFQISKNKMWIGEVMSNEVSFKILND